MKKKSHKIAAFGAAFFLALPLIASAQSYPSPTFNSVVLQNPLSPSNGGTGATTSTGTGSAVLSNSPSLTNPTISGGSISGLTTAVPVASGGTGANSASTALSNLGGAALSGATFTGATGMSATGPVFTLNDASGTTGSAVNFSRNGSLDWSINPIGSGDLIWRRFVSGGYAGDALSISNATGQAAFATRPTFNGATPWDSANLATTASTSGATFTGTLGVSAPGGGLIVNDSTGTTGSQLSFQESGANGWNIGNSISLGSFYLQNVGRGTVPFTLSNSTDQAAFSVRPTFNGATPFDSANLNFATPPAIGSTTRNAGYFTNLAANAGATVAGGLSVSAGISADSLNLTGPLTSTSDYGFHVSTVSSLPPDIGGGQNPVFYNIVDSDSVNAGSGFMLGHESRLLFGSSSSTGGRIAQYNFLQQNAVTSSSSGNRNYVGTASEITSSTGDGGTNLSSGAQGAYFAYSADARLNAGATNVLELAGGEIDTDVQAGAQPKYLIGWSIVGNNSLQGSSLDAAIDIGGNNQQGDGNPHAGWNIGIAFDDIHGQSPVSSNSTLMAGSFPSLGTQTILNGIDLNAFSCSNACFASNNFAVHGDGTIGTAGVLGDTNGSLATPGTIGQQLNNASSGVALTSGVTANGTSIPLGPGQFNVQCTAQFSPGATTTINSAIVGVNTVSASLPGYAQQTALQASFTAGNYQVLSSPVVFENLTAPSTTVYCPVFSGFGGTMSVNSTITVLRVH